MSKFSKKSLDRLATCHSDIQKVMNEVIKRIDITVIYGHRTVAEQAEIFAKGRKLVNGRWIKVGKTFTDKDGTINKSMHNYYPSKAIDIAKYPINWNDINGFIELNDIVQEEAKKLGITLVWGADWDSDGNIAEHSLRDYPHFQIKG